MPLWVERNDKICSHGLKYFGMFTFYRNLWSWEEGYGVCYKSSSLLCLIQQQQNWDLDPQPLILTWISIQGAHLSHDNTFLPRSYFGSHCHKFVINKIDSHFGTELSLGRTDLICSSQHWEGFSNKTSLQDIYMLLFNN